MPLELPELTADEAKRIAYASGRMNAGGSTELPPPTLRVILFAAAVNTRETADVRGMVDDLIAVAAVFNNPKSLEPIHAALAAIPDESGAVAALSAAMARVAAQMPAVVKVETLATLPVDHWEGFTTRLAFSSNVTAEPILVLPLP